MVMTDTVAKMVQVFAFNEATEPTGVLTTGSWLFFCFSILLIEKDRNVLKMSRLVALISVCLMSTVSQAVLSQIPVIR